MEILLDPEEKLICPYNPSHHIRRCKMNTHLIKCKKSYPDSKLVICDFNVNHQVPEPELQYHHENCFDRHKVEITVYQEEGTEIDKFPMPSVEVPIEESWDSISVTAYNPTEYCENSNVLRHLDVESAAKRKNFRVAERQRVGQLSNGPNSQHNGHDEPNLYVNPSPSRRNLPDRPTVSVEEVTPELVSTLMERVKIGRNKAYLAK